MVSTPDDLAGGVVGLVQTDRALAYFCDPDSRGKEWVELDRVVTDR